MAKLSHHGLTLEINFATVESSWIYYEIYFKWHDISMLNPKILHAGKENPSEEEALFAEDGEEVLVDTIQQVLSHHQPAYWEPMESDIQIAFYPGMVFPFIESPLAKAFANSGEPLPPLDNSIIQIIAKINTYNFMGESKAGSDGISLQMVVDEWQLHNFLKELKAEYQEFSKKHQDELEDKSEC